MLPDITSLVNWSLYYLFVNMERLSEIAKNIISQAPNWNFSGDCLILQWMEEISQNLETRAKKTTDSLDKLTKNIGRAQISLENTQNSLNALQYTQYVEMRCQDDEVYIEPENVKDEHGEKPKMGILKVFLQNNLTMLHNCHDRFNFVEDSDEDEVDNMSSGENCIYQPRNPYNERLLPHIYGTKLWKENWHVGLCEEGMRNYSGDEQSDVYSLSSSSSIENESIESHNTENLSQWTSSVSLNHENLNFSNTANYIPPIATSTILDLPFPEVIRIPEAPQKIQTNLNDETVRCEDSVESKTITSVSNENVESSSAAGVTKKKPVQSKTLNLFDDNDFENLMSGKAKPNAIETRSERVSTENPKVDLFSKNSATKTPNYSQATETISQKSATVNLFDSPTDEFPPVDHSKHSKTNSKLDLFADLDNSDYNISNYLSDSLNPSKIEKKTMISARSLFDDDDDGDDEFLNIFGKSKLQSSGTSTQIAKNEDNSFKAKRSSTILFDNDDMDVDDNDYIFSKTDRSATHKPVVNASKGNDTVNVMEKQKKVLEKDIFTDDFDNCVSDSISSLANKEKLSENRTQNEPAYIKQVNLHSKPTDFPTLENLDNESVFNKKAPTSSNTGAVSEDRFSKSLTAFMALEPPEDIPEQRENQSMTAFEQESNRCTDDEEFENLFGRNKSKQKANDITCAGDFHSTLLPSKIQLISEPQEGILCSKNIPTEIDDKGFNSITTSTIPEIDGTATPKLKSAVEETPSSRSENVLSSEKPEGILSLNYQSKVISKSLKSSDKQSGGLSAGSLHEKPVIKATSINITEFNETNDKQNQKGITPRTNEGSSHPIVMPAPPKITAVEATEEESHTLESNIPIQPYKPPTYDSYSPLFLDEPPDDDFFQTISTSVNIPQSNFESEFYEPTKNKIKVTNEVKPEGTAAQKSARYNISLFSEFPPDDEGGDDDYLESTFKNTKSISSVSNTDSSTHPIDIFKNMSAKESDNQVHQTSNEPKSVTNRLPRSTDMPQDIPPKATSTVTVSKLKMPNININVQALLPNTGGKPKIASTDSLKDKLLTAEPLQSSQNISVHKEQRSEGARENILPSLCKNRVRGPLKRRSSTRAGRQESYRQTLENERKEQYQEESTKNAKNGSLLKVNQADHDKDSIFDIKNIERNPIETPSKLPILQVPTAYQSQPSSKTSKNTRNNLFDDLDDNEDNDDFFTNLIKSKNSEKKSIQNLTKVAKESNDDLFKTSGKEAPHISEPKLPATSLGKLELTAKKSDALFGSDSNDDDDDDLFRTLSKPSVPIRASANASKKPKANNKSLFSDSDDDDDLFRSTTANTKKANSTKIVAASITKPTLNTQVEKPKLSAPPKTDNPLADLLDS